MSLQQGRGFLADLFKSFSKTGTSSAAAVYTVQTPDSGAVPPILPTTTIVKSIRLSNATGGSITPSITMTDNSNSDLATVLYSTAVAAGGFTEVLDQPIVLEQQDAINITGNGLVILVSIMEIT